MKQHGFLTLIQAGLVVFVLLAGFGGMQTYRLKYAQNELAGIKAAAKVLEEQNRKKAEGDLKLKEAKDAEYKRRIAALTSRYDGMLKSRPGVLPPAEPADSVAGATLACFDRNQLDATLARFIERVAGIAIEGDQAAIGLDLARGWVGELLRRQ